MLLWLFWSELSWVDQTLCYHKQTGSVDLTVLPLAHRIAQIEEIESKAGRQWTILSGKTTHREKLYM